MLSIHACLLSEDKWVIIGTSGQVVPGSKLAGGGFFTPAHFMFWMSHVMHSPLLPCLGLRSPMLKVHRGRSQCDDTLTALSAVSVLL